MTSTRLLRPVVFGFHVKELKGSSPCLGQRPQHVTVGCRAAGAENEETKSKRRDSKWQRVAAEPLPPEAAGEESAVSNAVPDQLQRHGRILDVAVGKQQQVPQAARRRQQVESLQGAPQLGAAPSWAQTLTGGEAENRQSDFILSSSDTMNAA